MGKVDYKEAWQEALAVVEDVVLDPALHDELNDLRKRTDELQDDIGSFKRRLDALADTLDLR